MKRGRLVVILLVAIIALAIGALWGHFCYLVYRSHHYEASVTFDIEWNKRKDLLVRNIRSKKVDSDLAFILMEYDGISIEGMDYYIGDSTWRKVGEPSKEELEDLE